MDFSILWLSSFGKPILFKHRNLKDIFSAHKGAKIEERSKEEARRPSVQALVPAIPTHEPQEDREIPIPLRFLYSNHYSLLY